MIQCTFSPREMGAEKVGLQINDTWTCASDIVGQAGETQSSWCVQLGYASLSAKPDGRKTRRTSYSTKSFKLNVGYP